MPIFHPVMQRVDSVYSGFPLLPIGNFSLMVKENFCLERAHSSCLGVSYLFVFIFACVVSSLSLMLWPGFKQSNLIFLQFPILSSTFDVVKMRVLKSGHVGMSYLNAFTGPLFCFQMILSKVS